MKFLNLLLLNLALCVNAAVGEVRIYETNVLVETIAGSGFAGHVDGQGTLTMFRNPQSLAIDSRTNVYVWDSGNYRIRRISREGAVTTFAGSGSMALIDGVGTNASFFTVYAMTVLPDDSLLVIDNTRLRRIFPSGQVTTLLTGGGYLDGPLEIAQFRLDYGRLTADREGNIYLNDRGNYRIRTISTNWVASTLAGSGNDGAIDGVGIFSSFSAMAGIAVDASQNTYVIDFGYGQPVLRKISSIGVVSTFVGNRFGTGYDDGYGTNAVLSGLELASDGGGNLYVAGHGLVRRITAEGMVTTLCGAGSGFLDGEGSVARFGSELTGIAVDRAGRVWVSDPQNQRIRRITYSPLPLTGFGIALYPGLSLTGKLGASYRIEYSDSISAPQVWTPATTVTLTNSPTLWFDTSGNRPRRFYRSVELP
jgi:hypothetical protein